MTPGECQTHGGIRSESDESDESGSGGARARHCEQLWLWRLSLECCAVIGVCLCTLREHFFDAHSIAVLYSWYIS